MPFLFIYFPPAKQRCWWALSICSICDSRTSPIYTTYFRSSCYVITFKIGSTLLGKLERATIQSPINGQQPILCDDDGLSTRALMAPTLYSQSAGVASFADHFPIRVLQYISLYVAVYNAPCEYVTWGSLVEYLFLSFFLIVLVAILHPHLPQVSSWWASLVYLAFLQKKRGRSLANSYYRCVFGSSVLHVGIEFWDRARRLVYSSLIDPFETLYRTAKLGFKEKEPWDETLLRQYETRTILIHLIISGSREARRCIYINSVRWRPHHSRSRIFYGWDCCKTRRITFLLRITREQKLCCAVLCVFFFSRDKHGTWRVALWPANFTYHVLSLYTRTCFL